MSGALKSGERQGNVFRGSDGHALGHTTVRRGVIRSGTEINKNQPTSSMEFGLHVVAGKIFNIELA